MNTPIVPSISYGGKVFIGLQFDVDSFTDLVKLSILSVNRSLVHFSRSKTKMNGDKCIRLKMSKDALMSEIGIYVEIIETGVFCTLQERDVRFDADTRKDIKKLFAKLEKLIWKLGDFDSDFVTMSSTQRARPKTELMEFIQKKW